MDDRLQWLDGLRAYAIALVVLIHVSDEVGLAPQAAAWAQMGRYGVQLFFVISAATITLTLSTKPDLRSWYARRYFRIAPLYYCAILFYGLLRFTTDYGGQPLSPAQWVAGAGASGLFLHGWHPGTINSIVPGGWSIAVEMMFYLIAPWLVAQFAAARFTAIHVALASAACILITMLLAGRVEPGTFFYFWPPLHAPVFLIALYAIHRERAFLFEGGQRKTSAAVCWCIAAGGWGLAAAFGAVGELSHALAPMFAGVGGTGLLLLAPLELRRVYANRLATAIGAVRYSMYIVHFAVIALLAGTGLFEHGLVVALSVVMVTSYFAAWSTMKLIEQPGIAAGRAVSRWLATTGQFRRATMDTD